jgi:hypothetical protein
MTPEWKVLNKSLKYAKLMKCTLRPSTSSMCWSACWGSVTFMKPTRAELDRSYCFVWWSHSCGSFVRITSRTIVVAYRKYSYHNTCLVFWSSMGLVSISSVNKLSWLKMDGSTINNPPMIGSHLSARRIKAMILDIRHTRSVKYSKCWRTDTIFYSTTTSNPKSPYLSTSWTRPRKRSASSKIDT